LIIEQIFDLKRFGQIFDQIFDQIMSFLDLLP